jgi:hypothetical protein
MKKLTMIIVGVVLIIAAVVAVIASDSMYYEAARYAVSKAEEMRMQANVVRYGGIGAGVIGGILFLAGLLKKMNNVQADT